MNERISILRHEAFDACKKYDDEGISGLVKTDEVFEKFAELIVSECIERIKQVVADEAMDVNPDYFVYDIKEHFGVKE